MSCVSYVRDRIRSTAGRLGGLAGLLALLLGIVLAGLALYVKEALQSPPMMTVSEDNPPVITLSGDVYFDWLEVRGPLPERMDNEGPSRIWKIVPAGPLPLLKNTPDITYGRVPAGFVQEEPDNGSPPSLKEGSVYGIGVVTRSSSHPYKTIIIRNGKAVEFHGSDRKIDNSNTVYYIPTDVTKLKVSGRIHFVPINYDVEVLKQLAAYYEKKYGLRIEIEPDIKTQFSRTYDVQRRQHVAEEFIAALRSQYQRSKGRESEVYIGFEAQDMYIRGEPWRYA